MSTDDFAHLHVHTEYSMLDGAAPVGKLAQEVAALGQSAVAMTDHGNLHGAYAFHKACVNEGVKPIIGMEAYCAPNNSEASERSKHEGYSGAGSYSHLTLLAENDRGLRNLFALSSEAYATGFYYKPRIDLNTLEQHKSGLIVASGCLSGDLSVRLQQDDRAGADAYVSRMRDVFGDSFYIEVMEHGFEREQAVLKGLLEISARHRVPTLGTNDSHYVRAGDALLHDAMLCLQTRAKLADETRMRFDGSGYFLKARALIDLPKEALDNTLLVAERVEKYTFDTQVKMPTSGYPYPAAELSDRAWSKLSNRATEYGERLEHELDIIIKLGFSDYFLVLADLLEIGRLAGCRFGPGRGSAGGSLVAYILGITQLDPIAHGLLFERFLNEHRVSLPDIDTDVDDSKRDQFLDLVREKYGAEFCAHIGTISTIGAKAALKDSARVLGHTYQVGTELTWALPRAEYGRAPSLSNINRSKALAVHEDAEDILDLAVNLEGLARQPGVHAAGFVISPEPIALHIPTWNKAGKGHSVTQWDQHAVEELGFVKFDFLGLSNLGVIDDTLRLLSGTGGTVPVLVCNPHGSADPATYSMLARGQSVGVFQLDSPGMQRLLSRVVPRSIHDIAAVLALYRPGPMGANAHREYADRKNDRVGIQYPHEEFRGKLEGILGPTYGLIVYQEQVMQTLVAVAGYTLSEADNVRKIMGKKDRVLLGAEEANFYKRTRSSGVSEDAAHALWDVLVPFADYAFNKSHAYGYAYLAYWTAYLKANHPNEYFSALLSHEGDPEKVTEYIQEVIACGLTVEPPSINDSEATWTPTKTGIRYGLATIKGVGEKVIAEIKARGPYVDWRDFLWRSSGWTLRSNTVAALIQSGATDCFGSREGLLVVYLNHLQAVANEKAEIAKGERRLLPLGYEIPNGDVDYPQRLRDEVASLGVALSTPPIRVQVPVDLSSADWEYVAGCVDRNRGTAVLTIACGSWTLVCRQVDRKILDLLKPIGAHPI